MFKFLVTEFLHVTQKMNVTKRDMRTTKEIPLMRKTIDSFQT